MATTPAVYPALGTALSVDKAGTGTTYTPIGQVMSIDGPSNEIGSSETTHLGSTRKTFRPTLPAGGEVTFELEYDPSDTAGHAFLRGLADSPQVLSWRVSYPLTPVINDTFEGFLTKFSTSAGGPEDNLMASATIKVTGAVVTAVAS